MSTDNSFTHHTSRLHHAQTLTYTNLHYFFVPVGSLKQTRQLNLWGFVRTGKKIWRHNQSLFHRDRPFLMKKIERTALKSSPPSSDPLIGTTVVTTATVPVVDSSLDSINALIIAGGGIPITQQFTSDELLYLADMFEEDETIISSIM